ncbi:hypothetical protein DMENIID0001_041270 [Sergentomyia squamirostris]
MPGRSFNCGSNILDESPPGDLEVSVVGLNDIRPSAEQMHSDMPPATSHLRVGPLQQPRQPLSAVIPSNKRVIIGRAKSGGSLPVIPKFRWLFVTRLSREVTAERLSEFMSLNLSSRRAPKCYSLVRADVERRVASFRVALMPDEFEEAMSEDFWDLGVFVSEFTFRKDRKKNPTTDKQRKSPMRRGKPPSASGGGESAARCDDGAGPGSDRAGLVEDGSLPISNEDDGGKVGVADGGAGEE